MAYVSSGIPLIWGVKVLHIYLNFHIFIDLYSVLVNDAIAWLLECKYGSVIFDLWDALSCVTPLVSLHHKHQMLVAKYHKPCHLLVSLHHKHQMLVTKYHTCHSLVSLHHKHQMLVTKYLKWDVCFSNLRYVRGIYYLNA